MNVSRSMARWVPEQYVIDFVRNERRILLSHYTPSFFELTTALAFKYFAEQKVDIAIVEVGLGGRLDCTDIVTPILSVITNISLRSYPVLRQLSCRNSREKGRIIKQGVPTIIGKLFLRLESFSIQGTEKDSVITFAEDISIPTFITFSQMEALNIRHVSSEI